jgi:hypothetical protein
MLIEAGLWNKLIDRVMAEFGKQGFGQYDVWRDGELGVSPACMSDLRRA